MSQVLYEAIYKRKSVRKYSDRKLAETYLSKVENMIEDIELLDPNINLQVHLVEDGLRIQNIMKGLVGIFGKILAPHYLVVTSEDKEGYLTNAGYA